MKDGEILHRGEPEAITKEVSGKVWECKVPHNKVNEYTYKYNVGNLKNDGEDTILRIVADEQPMEGAKGVAPTLEDLYLYYFREIEEGDWEDERIN